MTEQSRLAQLASDPRIPTPPALALQILQKASRPDCSLTEVSKLVSRDPGLCVKVLGLVNTALFGLPKAITSVDRAIQLLGLRRVRALVLALALPSTAQHCPRDKRLQDFWKNSLVGALVAREMAIHLRWEDPENELVAGLLRDLGVLAFLQVCPAEYAKVLATPAVTFAQRQCELEQQVLGVHHAEVSSHLLEQWRLPKEITEAIRYHHSPAQAEALGPSVLERARLLHFGSSVATLNIEPESLPLRANVLYLAKTSYGLKEEQLRDLLAPLAEQVNEFAAVLHVDVGQLVDYSSVLNQTTEELTRFTVETSLENLRLSEEKGRVQESCARVEAALQQTEEQLRHTQKLEALGRVTGGVAHDFNNLLTAINGYSELCITLLSPSDPVRGLIQEIKKAGDRAAVLVQRLLAFSRKQVIEPVALDLNEVVTDMVKMLRRVIGENIQVVLRLEPVMRPIKADASQLEQVLLNLVVNARDAMPRGGTMTIETSSVTLSEADVQDWPDVSAGPFAKLIVRDTGCGMDDNVREHLFEPFFTTKPVGSGTGLGLATVYGIVKQSQAFIVVDSAPGQGATFTIFWPHVGSTEIRLGTVPIQSSLLGGTETVLLVDDEECVCDVTSRALKLHGYTVLSTRDPREALRIGACYPGAIHLLVTDVLMPGMNGFELHEQLAHIRTEMKSLFMTGHSDDALERLGGTASDFQLLRKPFGPQALARKVREVLGNVHPAAVGSGEG